jgi:hypothetical protein
MAVKVSTYIFLVLTGLVLMFQVALAAGMPWGELTWGGKFPGRLPPRMRGLALFTAALVLLFGLIVAVRAGLLLPHLQPLSRTLIWGVAAYFVLGVLAHILTKSRWERLIWLPVVAAMLVCSITVALS